MKAFVLLLTLAFASRFMNVESRMTMTQIHNTIKNVRKACLSKTGASKELLDATHRGEFAEDRALMCVYQCAMNSLQGLKDGHFDEEILTRKVLALLPLDILDRAQVIITACAKEVTSDDGCEGVYQYARCNWRMDPELYFFP